MIHERADERHGDPDELSVQHYFNTDTGTHDPAQPCPSMARNCDPRCFLRKDARGRLGGYISSLTRGWFPTKRTRRLPGEKTAREDASCWKERRVSRIVARYIFLARWPGACWASMAIRVGERCARMAQDEKQRSSRNRIVRQSVQIFTYPLLSFCGGPGSHLSDLMLSVAAARVQGNRRSASERNLSLVLLPPA